MPWKTDCAKEQRWKFVQQLLRVGKGLAELCRQWKISRKTAYKWVARFEQRGRWGLGDAPRVAKDVHNRPSPVWLARIRRWRRVHPSWGAPKLRWGLKKRFGARGLPSEASISRWLQKWGMSRRRRRMAHKGVAMERPGLTMARQPNDVWTVDFKGWFRTGDGVRVEPLTVRDLASRYVLAADVRRRQAVEDCRGVFEKLFKEYGLPRTIRSDNGAPFGSTGALGLTRLSAWWVKLGIGVEFIAPGRPDQNGGHEQMHRVYRQEAVAPAAKTFGGQRMRSAKWRRQYNEQRPHEGIGMRVPAEVYRKSPRLYEGGSGPLRYDLNWESRLVKGKGMISFQGQHRFIGEAFEGERVGLKRKTEGVWEVYYGVHLLGELWDRDGGSGIRARWYRTSRSSQRRRRSPRGSATARSARLRSTAR